jgi:hypothetical protein
MHNVAGFLVKGGAWNNQPFRNWRVCWMCGFNKLEAAMLRCTLLKGKVSHIASKFGTQGFKASNGWINSFKQQHNVV